MDSAGSRAHAPGDRLRCTRNGRIPARKPEAELNLFESQLRDQLKKQAPLADRLRPTSLDEIVGQTQLLGPGRPLRALVEADRLSSVILWGPPGTGKTTLARVIASSTNRAFVPLSAVTAGVKDVRDTVDGARRLLAEHGRPTILFLDEVHRFNKAQQDALLPSVEDGTLTLIGATTENPYFEVNAPLLSRSTLFRLEPLSEADLRTLAQKGLNAEEATADDDAVAHLINLVDGDGRALLTSLEVAIAIAPDRHVTLEHAESARGARALRYERDDHYDVISAFIKSLRGSDPDAGLYWLARMLTAGEDARYIARRLVILASEDIGMADPMSLLIANAAAHAVEYVGLPEAQLNLAQAVVHLALAPKSNRSAEGIWKALSDVQQKPAGPVPAHLRDAHYYGARKIGHGVGYVYSHDHPDAEQQFLPDDLVGTRYYEPPDT